MYEITAPPRCTAAAARPAGGFTVHGPAPRLSAAALRSRGMGDTVLGRAAARVQQQPAGVADHGLISTHNANPLAAGHAFHSLRGEAAG